ncbi:flavin reductase family protein [Pseudoalteromonas sp. SG43-6]|uniref:flavin reductase family protein n=1 Tax=Pseudoalteromonas sp. SG43-6 TaxID=2760967 RepID=UPI0015FEC7E9|nr:flavin reductase family protein [Pseudoalteromonas sp. SG43-6]MBB1433644.1 flavin reductase family protein [Pseudoalteromonas sp. SG43-6]
MYFDLTDPDEQKGAYSKLVGGITPRPIAWISTLSSDGVANIAPYSFFTVASVNPPVLSVTQVNPAENQNKDTLNNLLATKECVINVVSHNLVEQMNQSCGNFSSQTSEFTAVGIASCASQSVTPLGVAAAKVRYECSLRDVVTISEQEGGGQMMLLNVVGIYIDESVLVNGYIDPRAINTVGKMGGDYFTTTHDLFSLARPEI